MRGLYRGTKRERCGTCALQVSNTPNLAVQLATEEVPKPEKDERRTEDQGLRTIEKGFLLEWKQVLDLGR